MIGLILIICLSGISNVLSAKHVLRELERYLTDNGHRHVDVIYNKSFPRNWFVFRPKVISVARVEIAKVYRRSDGAFGVFIFDADKDDMRRLLGYILQWKVRMSLLFFSKPTLNGIVTLKDNIDSLRDAGLFYVAMLDISGTLTWYSLITLKTGNVVEMLSFAGNSLSVVESYDLQGLEVRSTTLSWEPFYSIGNCNNVGLECKTHHGYLKDYMDMLAVKLNFTYISHRNTDNNWGVVPKKGPHNLNGTWEGVFGDIVNKKYDISISTWYWTFSRAELGQFVPIVKARHTLASNRQQSKTDFGLLVRGFTKISWMSILMMIFLLCLCIFAQRIVGPKGQNKSLKVMVFSLGLLFIMIRAYYSAALTKFFTVMIPHPFETERDVLQAFPEWHFMFRKGDEALVYSHVLQGDADYIAFWKRHTTNPEGTTYGSAKEALQHIGRGNIVISTDEGQFLGYLRRNPSNTNLHIFGHGRWKYNALLFHRNSPLLPMFKQGVNHFREKGIESQLHLKWIGMEYNDGGSLFDTTVLTPGQVVLAFTFISLLYWLSFVILGGEVITKKVLNTGRISKITSSIRRASI